MRILGMIIATSALLAACGETREDAPAGPSAVDANQGEPAAIQAAEASNQSGAPIAEVQAADSSVDRAEPETGGPCSVQDGKALTVASVRAVGTEPFWNASVEGRCVTYSTPEDQKGTRIWTRFTPGPGGGTWTGDLNGARFELRIRPERGCSDGMSDKVYPLAAEIAVGGERRRGCASPA